MTRYHPLNDVFDVDATESKLPVTIERKAIAEEQIDVDSDAQLASRNLKILIELGQTAAQRASEVAEDSEEPRAYEVLGNLLKTMSDMNIQLLDIHEKKRKIKGAAPSDQQNNTVNNTAVFVGTTAGLMEMLEQHRKDKQ